MVAKTNRKRSSAPKKRSGCFSCKDAHVQCTEERPSCKRCSRLSLKCVYGLKLIWQEDSASKNMAHGRAGVWSKDGRARTRLPLSYDPSPQRHASGRHSTPRRVSFSFENLTVHDFMSGRAYETFNEPPSITDTSAVPPPEDDNDFDELIVRNLPPVMTTPSSKHYSDVEGHLFNYFMYELGPKCSLSSARNPYLTILLPLAFDHKPLRHAILAASANALRLDDDLRFEEYALKHKSAALRSLRQTINAGQIDWRALATTLMFCFYDVSLL